MTQDDLEARRDRLRKTLAEHEAAEQAEEAKYAKADTSGYAAAFRLSSEFVSAIVVGAALGYGLDYLLGTAPWLMVALLLLGFAAGVLNVLRSAGLIQEPQAGKRRRDGS